MSTIAFHRGDAVLDSPQASLGGRTVLRSISMEWNVDRHAMKLPRD